MNKRSDHDIIPADRGSVDTRTPGIRRFIWFLPAKQKRTSALEYAAALTSLREKAYLATKGNARAETNTKPTGAIRTREEQPCPLPHLPPAGRARFQHP